MQNWPGGLPPAAHERIARQRASGVAGSLLSASGAAAVRTVELAPVGEVFGCVVEQLAYGAGQCGIWRSGATWPGGPTGALATWTAWTSPVLTTGTDGRSAGFGSYVAAVQQAWHGAVGRMVAEAAALGADGVVGVRVRRARLEGASREFTATGTAVRTLDGSVTPAARSADDVWTASCSPEEVAALVRSGWVPRGMTLGMSVATKHVDPTLKSQRSTWAGNVEVDGLTQLVTAARHDARVQLARRAAPFRGSDVVVTASSLSEFETPCGEEPDLHAEASFVGTVIAPGPMHAFRGRSERAATARDVTTVLPLRDRPRGTR